jgi:hypothetical protein
MKHLGGLSDERPGEVTNNTLNVSITDEQRVAALMALSARVRGATTNADTAQEPMEQSPVVIQKNSLAGGRRAGGLHIVRTCLPPVKNRSKAAFKN